jgi:hypothetical protein
LAPFLLEDDRADDKRYDWRCDGVLLQEQHDFGLGIHLFVLFVFGVFVVPYLLADVIYKFIGVFYHAV